MGAHALAQHRTCASKEVHTNAVRFVEGNALVQIDVCILANCMYKCENPFQSTSHKRRREGQWEGHEGEATNCGDERI